MEGIPSKARDGDRLDVMTTEVNFSTHANDILNGLYPWVQSVVYSVGNERK